MRPRFENVQRGDAQKQTVGAACALGSLWRNMLLSLLKMHTHGDVAMTWNWVCFVFRSGALSGARACGLRQAPSSMRHASVASIKPLESTLQLQMSVYFECLCMLADKHTFQLLRNGGWTCGVKTNSIGAAKPVAQFLFSFSSWPTACCPS